MNGGMILMALVVVGWLGIGVVLLTIPILGGMSEKKAEQMIQTWLEKNAAKGRD